VKERVGIEKLRKRKREVERERKLEREVGRKERGGESGEIDKERKKVKVYERDSEGKR
jgi:hypothetical protein